MKIYIFVFWNILCVTSSTIVYDFSTECDGKTFKNVTLSGYFPQFGENPRLFTDMRGKKLRTLQDYLDYRTEFVTLALDASLHIPYGTEVCIPELNRQYGRRLRFQVRDKGSDLQGKKYTRADICVRTETDSYDDNVNKIVTLVF